MGKAVMAKPSADTDKEIIQQMKNLKEGILERVTELQERGYEIDIRGNNFSNFTITVSKTIDLKEEI